ncbi:MAG: DUF1631 domain-containing protein [Comamonadaceae bacterium]|nr:DUF1631 domain-containing protein [Comamonadaceae bacterium]
MVTPGSTAPTSPLSRSVRQRFVAEVDGVILDMAATAQGRLTALADQPGVARDQQARRDALHDFLRLRDTWIHGVRQAWQQALVAPGLSAPRRDGARDQNLTLIGEDEVENGILVSRLVLAISDKVSWELKDLRLRVASLEGGHELADKDVLKPATFAAVLVNQWTACGLSRLAWTMMQDSLAPMVVDRLFSAYQHANEFLIRNGIMPVIETKSVIRRSADGSAAAAPTPASKSAGSRAGGASAGAARPGDGGPGGAGPGGSAAGSFAGGTGGSARGHAGGASTGFGDRSGALPSGSSGPSTGAGAGGGHASSWHGHTRSALAEETRMMTATTPLARARQRAQGVLGQLRRLFVDRGADFEATRQQAPSPELAQALVHERGVRREAYVTGVGVLPAGGVQQVAGEIRERSAELKRKATTVTEKATIEIVALMFQAILAEERIPAGVRVWFARLQMPVLRVALDEPEFFGTLQHPARQLIDRMGSCVLGFDASGVQASAMESEIRRVVQVIEQYPETGRRVFQLVLEEFQKFLSRFLTEKGSTQRLVSVAQQVEQKETLTIQYTIELRNMLNKIKVRDEIREFLFKVWAEALAVAALRHGAQHADTLTLKRTATDLLWAASAKPNREDRARVIQALPKILRHLRQGMSLLGLPATTQDAHLKIISDILADAFQSKTDVVSQEDIDDMARRLEQLEVAISDDGPEEFELDPGTLEAMLGVDASSFEMLANSGSTPSQAMIAWASELELGQWFVLEHNGRVVQVQLVWRSDRRQLHLFASADGQSYLIQARRLAAYLQAGLLVPAEEEALTVRATREALTKLDANPERLLS